MMMVIFSGSSNPGTSSRPCIVYRGPNSHVPHIGEPIYVSLI